MQGYNLLVDDKRFVFPLDFDGNVIFESVFANDFLQQTKIYTQANERSVLYALQYLV